MKKITGGVFLDMNKTDNLSFVKNICEKTLNNAQIPAEKFDNPRIKSGLRNKDGSGVIAGVTNICNVHGYIINEGEKENVPGELIYRGINIKQIIENINKENRYGFEETAFLLLTGELPDKKSLSDFETVLSKNRELPENFFKDMILAAPSPSVMNKMARSVLALYSYDENAEDDSLQHEMQTALNLIAKLPIIMVCSEQVKRSYYDRESMILHPLRPEENTAQTILSILRPNREYTEEQARLLDILLILHAEHGGGNNSTFAARVLTSSMTDPYSAYSAAIGSLKGKRHGGANINTVRMLNNIKENISNYQDETEIAAYLEKIVRKETGDCSGLVYGMGHAVYTLSDPRAEILKAKAFELAADTVFEKDFHLIENIEKLTPKVMSKVKGKEIQVCANVDLYSGLVYRMLDISEDIITPLFACARITGWCAHRIEELLTTNRIIRPAYKAISKLTEYIPLEERNFSENSV